MPLYLYDDEAARRLEPFALTRPVGELRAGAEIIRRRWERVAGERATGHLAAPHLARFEELDAPPAAAGDLAPGALVVNARFVVALDESLDAAAVAFTNGGQVVAARLTSATPATRFADGAARLDTFAGEGGTRELRGRWITDVWDFIGTLQATLVEDIPILVRELTVRAPEGAHVIGAGGVFIEEGATVEPWVVFDASAGPVLVRRGATVHAFTRVVGPCFIGESSSVAGDKIAGCSIGEVCRIHGEISSTIVLGHTNKGHDGFVGHSYMGRWVNLGAGTTTSNLKNTYGTVALWTTRGVRDSGLQFLGTMFGDHAKTGIGLRLTTGTVLGAGANVYDAMPPKYVAPFSWGGAEPYGAYDAAKFAQVAERAMARRGVTLGDGAKATLAAAYAKGRGA